MNDDPCLLTIGDFSTLTALQEQWYKRNHDLTRQLRAKLDTAEVVFPDDLPRDVASLGSRIAYAIGEERHVAVLTATIGLDRDSLPITLPIAFALLGRREGWAKHLEVEPARCRLLTLGRVLEQPEASWPGRFSPHGSSSEIPRRLRIAAETRAPRTKFASPDDGDAGPTTA